VDNLAAPDILLQYSLHAPRSRRREGLHDRLPRGVPDLSFAGTADLIVEGDFVVGRREGGGTDTGPAFGDFLAGALPAGSGRRIGSAE
jgi:hypothetical protein